MEAEQTLAIGNVLRADIRGFVVASRLPEPEVPTFGAFVRAPIQQDQASLVGLVYDIRLQDDPFLRNLAATIAEGDRHYDEIIRDQQENRVIPVEIAVVAIGYMYQGDSRPRYGYPPQPPMILHRISLCSAEAIRAITAAPDYLQALVTNQEIPADELIPAAILRAAQLRTGHERADHLLEAGRYLARALGRDPTRLERILRHIAG